MKKQGRYVLLDMLVDRGIRYVFGNPGTTELPLMDALQDYGELKYILSLHEPSAVAMADGYARATGKPSFVNLHGVGGLAGGLVMLYDAFKGGTPMVATCGQFDTRMLMEEPLFSGNLIEMGSLYTKWSGEILHGRDIPRAVRRAFRIASTPPTGPVFLSLPWNALTDEIEPDLSSPSTLYAEIRPDRGAVEEAAGLLAKAKKPLMLVGDRVAQARAVPAAVKAAELLGAAVMGVACMEVDFPTGHPQFEGPLNVDSTRTRDVLVRYDVIFAVGCSVVAQFLYAPDVLSGKEQLVHLDVNAREIEKNHAVKVGIWGDIGKGLEDVYDALDGSMSTVEREAARMRRIELGEAHAKRREEFLAMSLKKQDQKPMDDAWLFLDMKDITPSNTIFTFEAPSSQRAFMRAFDFNEPGSLFGMKGGALGWAIGGTIGVKLAQPARPVVCVVADGAAMYSIQGLWTAAQYGVPVVYIICNNRSYRILKHFTNTYYFPLMGIEGRKSDYIGMNFFEHPQEFVRLAEGFGVQGFKVDNREELKRALEKALESGKPALLDVLIDPGDF